MITAPGVYAISSDDYLADPVEDGSLSSTGARMLLPPSCPALYRHAQDHPKEPKRHYDIGTAAHLLVLGVGPELIEVEHDSWRTNASKDAAEAARADGAVPLLTKDYERVHAMAAALREHEGAARLLAAGTGLPEQTLVWRDPATEVWCRARPDWLPHWLTADHRQIVFDYKTAAAADVESFEKAIATYGYHQQADWYLDGLVHTGLAADRAHTAFVFIVQEKEPPYLPNIFEIDIAALQRGAAQNHYARAIYAACTAANRWPGYADDIQLAALPRYAELRIDAALDRGDYTALIPTAEDSAA